MPLSWYYKLWRLIRGEYSNVLYNFISVTTQATIIILLASKCLLRYLCLTWSHMAFQKLYHGSSFLSVSSSVYYFTLLKVLDLDCGIKGMFLKWEK